MESTQTGQAGGRVRWLQEKSESDLGWELAPLTLLFSLQYFAAWPREYDSHWTWIRIKSHYLCSWEWVHLPQHIEPPCDVSHWASHGEHRDECPRSWPWKGLIHLLWVIWWSEKPRTGYFWKGSIPQNKMRKLIILFLIIFVCIISFYHSWMITFSPIFLFALISLFLHKWNIRVSLHIHIHKHIPKYIYVLFYNLLLSFNNIQVF
jgi:hypothetical protein